MKKNIMLNNPYVILKAIGGGVLLCSKLNFVSNYGVTDKTSDHIVCNSL